jgi:drug/metabolite transporter (DMT)-like permease
LGREYAVLLLATLVWGAVHPTVKFALSELSPMQLALLRPACACLVLMLAVLVSRRAPRLVEELRAAPGTLVLLGVLGFALSGGLTSLALSFLPAGITSLFTNTSPLIVVCAGLVLARRQIGQLEVGGALVGFGGLALLTLSDVQLSGDLGATLLGTVVALGSAACWAVYTGLARRLGRADPIVTTALTSAIGSLAVAVVALPSQDWGRLVRASAPVLLATFWAGAVSTGCTYVAWSYALRRLPAVVVAPFGYLIPVSALTISHVWLGEPLTVPVVLGASLVLAGVALTQLNHLRLLRTAGAKSRA